MQSIRVKDVMTRDVVSTTGKSNLLEAAATMRSLHVSGLPVVGESGELAGVISEKDIVRVLRQSMGLGSARSLLDVVLETSGEKRGRVSSKLVSASHRLEHLKVSEAMTREAITVDPEAPLSEAGRIMSTLRVNRLPVVTDGRLDGIVTRQDILTGVMKIF
jgi:CBS domain-containing protein